LSIDRQTTERNMRYLVIEIFWAAIFNGCLAFNQAYIIRLGGDTLLISLLTAGAALVNAMFTMPFAAFLERRTNHRPWMIWSICIARFGHLGLIFIPWIIREAHQAEAVVILLVLLNLPVAMFNAGFLPMHATVIPLNRRARIFSARNITLGATLAVCTFLFGLWLDYGLLDFPQNYQVLYGIGVITATLSTVSLARIVMPANVVPPKREKEDSFLHPSMIKMLWREQRPFMNMVLNTLIFNIPAWMLIPLQPIYFVRVLDASDAWIGLLTTLVSAGTIGGNLLWERVIRRKGFMWALIRGCIMNAFYYILIALFPNLTMILIFGMISGFVNPGIDLSHFNILLGVSPEDRRPTYLGFFTTVMNVGSFVAPLLVAPLALVFGEQLLVLLLGIMRLLGATLFYFNPVQYKEDAAQAR
jgi:MFS family permease